MEHLVEVEKGREGCDGRPSVGPAYQSVFAKDGFPEPIPGLESCCDVFRMSVEKNPRNRMLGRREFVDGKDYRIIKNLPSSEEQLKPLEWEKRLSIALDVARGVEYLHSLAHQSFIIYKDLKPSNILLGDDMKAKVADFGLVRLTDGKGGSIETKLAGTFGLQMGKLTLVSRMSQGFQPP